MRKLHKKSFKGIEYIRLESLSATEAESLRLQLNDRTLIKILQNEVILTDCVLYSAYESWYESIESEKSIEPVFDLIKQPEPSLT